MKKISFFVVFCMIFSAFFIPSVYAQEFYGTCGDNISWTLDNNGTLTIDGTGEMRKDIYIDFPWKLHKEKIKSVIVKDGIKNIGPYAFSSCKSLENVSIPDSVTLIEDGAFTRCDSIKKVTLPQNVNSLGMTAFASCVGLKEINIPDSVEYIGEGAFIGCTALESITIKNFVVYMGNMAFANVSEKFTMEVYKDSYAEKYAKEKGISIVYIDGEIMPPDVDSYVYMDKTTYTMPNLYANALVVGVVEGLRVYNISVSVTDKNGKKLAENSSVGTGCKVIDQEGDVYTVIVKGDTDGSGEIDSTDYLRIKSHFLNNLFLKDAYFQAADTDKSGTIDSTDYLKIKNYLLGNLDLYK